MRRYEVEAYRNRPTGRSGTLGASERIVEPHAIVEAVNPRSAVYKVMAKAGPSKTGERIAITLFDRGPKPKPKEA